MNLFKKLPKEIIEKIESYIYNFPFRLTYIKCGKCYICGAENTHVDSEYIDLHSLLGYQFCKNCVSQKELSKRIYMKRNKLISLQPFIGENESQSVKVRRSNGTIEDWFISLYSPVSYNRFYKDWVVPVRSESLEKFKSVRLKEITSMNPRNSILFKIKRQILTF